MALGNPFSPRWLSLCNSSKLLTGAELGYSHSQVDIVQVSMTACGSVSSQVQRCSVNAEGKSVSISIISLIFFSSL